MKYLLSLVSAVLLTSATTAFSADAVSQIPEAPAAQETAAPFQWDGVYLGGLAGYGWTKASGELFEDIGTQTFNGARLGGFVGYNFGLGNNVILGLEGDVNHDWNKRSFDDGGFHAQTGISGSARVRAGYAIDNLLVYGAGGWTATRVKAEDEFVKATDTANGWTVGAGVDYAFTNNLFGRVEYRYNDYGKASLEDVDVKLKQHVVNVGVGVKF